MLLGLSAAGADAEDEHGPPSVVEDDVPTYGYPAAGRTSMWLISIHAMRLVKKKPTAFTPSVST
jgi:hypothetical protein